MELKGFLTSTQFKKKREGAGGGEALTLKFGHNREP